MSPAQTFIRKPVVETVQARRVPSMPADASGVMEEIRDIATWCNGRIDYGSFAPRIIFPLDRFDGREVAFTGDWILCNEAGEFTRISNLVFEATYELGTADQASSLQEQAWDDGYSHGVDAHTVGAIRLGRFANPHRSAVKAGA